MSTTLEPATEAAAQDAEGPSSPKTALIMVDIQADFLPGGALAIDDGDKVVKPLLQAAKRVDFRVATADAHPENHVSFEAQGGLWPEHCVAGTTGQLLHPAIAPIADLVVEKGGDPNEEAYSGFDGTPLAQELRNAGVQKVLIGGLATEYCVQATALDALKEGFKVEILATACRAVKPRTGEAALRELENAGALVHR